MQTSMTKPCVAMAGAQMKMPVRTSPKQSTLKLMKNKKATNAPTYKQMLVWEPEDNKQFETFSYLPPLTDDQIAKQIDYIIGNNWVPCLEFANPENAYIKDVYPSRFCGTSSTYYDNRYWTMWKLPMFGCRDPSQVLREINEASEVFPKAYVRLLAFDSNRQVQVLSFLVHRPPGESGYTPLDKRSRGVGQ